MKSRIVILTTLAALALMLVANYSFAKLKPGEKPQWALTTLDDKQIDSTTYSDKVVVIEFWATWCPPCVAQVPHLKKLNEKYAGQVELISVSVDEDLEAQKKFIEKNEMDWTHANDHKQTASLAEAWGVGGIPQAFIFSASGELLWEGHPGNMDKPLARAVKAHESSDDEDHDDDGGHDESVGH